jgi:hypothetical protein
MATILSKFLFSLSYRAATLLPDTALAGQKHSPPNAGIDTNTNPYLRYPSTSCALLVSQLEPLLRYLFPYTFTVIAFVRNNRFRVRQFGNQIRCYRTVIDLSTGDFKLGWQAITINYQVNLCGIACVAFSDRLCFLARCACTMLVRFNIAAINK